MYKFILNFNSLLPILLCLFAPNIVSSSSEYSKGDLQFICQIFSNNFKDLCHPKFDLTNVLKENKITVNADIKIQFDAKFSVENEPKLPNNQCQACERIMRRYDQTINKSLSIEFVQTKFLGVCEIFDEKVKSLCVIFFKTKGLDMIKSIVLTENSKTICQLLNLCTRRVSNEIYNEFMDLLLIDIFQKPNIHQCTNCQASIDYFKRHLNSVKNSEKIKFTVMDYCQIFKKNFQNLCKIFLLTNGFETIKSIQKKSESKEICQQLKVCETIPFDLNNTEVINTSAVYHEVVVDQKCNLCKHMIKLLEKSVNKTLNATNIQNRAIYACSVLQSPLYERCVTFYNGTGLNIITAVLADEEPKNVCKIMNLCKNHSLTDESNYFLDLLNSFMTIEKLEKCKICRIHIRWLERNYNRSNSLVLIQDIVENVCGIFNCPYEHVCKQFYFKIGFDVRERTLPRLVCQNLEFCLPEENKEISPVKSIKSNSVSRKSDKYCKKCKWIIKRYEFALNISLSAEIIQNKILQVCDIYNKTVKDLCEKFYNGKGLEIIKAILQSEDPKKICQIIHLCLDKDEESQYNNFFDLLQIHFSRKEMSDRCKTCIKIIKFEEKNINTSKSAQDIQQTLFGYCSIFKMKFEKHCHNYFNKTGLKIVQSILNQENPKTVCENLQYCYKRNIGLKSYDLKDLLSVIYEKEIDENCKVCKVMIKFYEVSMNKSMDPTEIQSKIISACDIYKLSVKSQCVFFYNTVGFDVIKSILTNDDATNVCKLMNICVKDADSDQKSRFLDLLKIFTLLDSKNKCHFCLNSVSWFENNIEHSNSPKNVQKSMFNVCGILYSHYRYACVKYYSTTGLDIIKAFLNNVSSRKICQKMHFCHKKHVEMKSLEKGNIFKMEFCKIVLVRIDNEFSNLELESTNFSEKILPCSTNEMLKSLCVNSKTIKLKIPFYMIIKSILFDKICDSVDNMTTKPLMVPKESNTCRLCKEIVFIVDQLTIPNKTEKSLQEAFSKACIFFPISLNAECRSFVNKYQNEIIKLILEKYPLQYICSKILVCSKFVAITETTNNHQSKQFKFKKI